MAGTLLVVGVVVGAGLLASGYASVGVAAVASQHAAAAADAAALAAADAVLGVATGDPCSRAAEVASAGGAVLTSCAVGDLEATVTVSVRAVVGAAQARARAGLPVPRA